MEAAWSDSLAKVMLLQQSGSINKTLSCLVEQSVACSESEEDQEVLLSAISYFTKSMDATDIEADIVNSILHKVCYPHVRDLLVSMLAKQGEYTLDPKMEKAADICRQCLPLSKDDATITVLLQSITTLLSDVFLMSDERLSDAQARGLRILSRLLAAFIPALSDAAMQPLQAPLAGLLRRLLCSASCQSAAALVAPALLSRPGFSITRTEVLLTSLLVRGRDDLGRRLSAANVLHPFLPQGRYGAPAAPLMPLLTAGVSAANPLHRREARRLLRNCCGGGAAWEDLLLLLEALEEKQLHLVQPALTKLESLLANTNGVPLHYSLCVLRRAAAHAAAAVRRWAVLRMLQLEPSAEVELLVTEALLPALNDSSLYSDVEKACWNLWEQNATHVYWSKQFCASLLRVGDWSVPTECGRRLREFVTRYLSSNDWRLDRASALVSALCQTEWSAVTLCHVTLALATVPPARCLDRASVRALCRLGSDRVLDHEPVLRNSSQLSIFRMALTWFDWEHNSDLECLVALARLCSVEVRRYIAVERCCPLYSLLGESKLAELRVGQSSGLDLREMLSLALQESSGPTRGRELGGVCRLLSASLPLTQQHPALVRLRAGLQRCFSEVYRPVSDVLGEVALLTALAARFAADPVSRVVTDVAPSVTAWIIRQVEAAEEMDDFERCTDYGQFLRVCTRELRESVVLKLCSMAGKDRPLTLLAVVATVVDCGGDLSTYQPGTDVYNAFFRLVLDAVDDSVTTALASCSGAGALHLQATWRIASKLLMFRQPDQTWCQIARRAVEMLPVCPRRALHPLLSALRQALPGLGSDDAALTAAAISAGWTALGEHRGSGVFSQALKPFVQLVFYKLTDSSQLSDQVRQTTEELLQLSETVPAALLHLTQAVKDNYRVNRSKLFRVLAVDIAVSALLYGDVHRRDRRIPAQTIEWLQSVSDISDPAYICSEEIFTLGLSVLQLIVQHDHELAEDVIRRLMASAASAAEGRQFANSAAHRRLLRGWRVLLLLAMKASEGDGLAGLWDDLCQAACSALVRRRTQPSVRRLQELTVMKLCVKLPKLCRHLWHHLQQAGSERTATAGSFAFILTHLAELGLSGDCGSREMFVHRCYSRVLSGCMAQNFSTRACSQAALSRLWSLAEKHTYLRVISKFSVAHKAAQEAQQMARTSANSAASTPDDTYFSQFDPGRDCSEEDVLVQLPRLMGVEPDEWGRLTSVPTSEPSQQLFHLKTGSWGTRGIPAGSGDDAGGDICAAPADTQVQRKTTPLRPAPCEDRGGGDASAAGLVVAASLVEKAANLGGLCRTCEVLGVGGLVLSSLRKTDERDFQSLSVSAERWLNVTEVPPRQLPEYLQRMRADGYTLVGVEQTSDSQPANQYQFPAKTLLLLGNEKQGIPGDVLQLLDVCLEIPQRGVVRSLNVHVAGSLLMWEYCRQHC